MKHSRNIFEKNNVYDIYIMVGKNKKPKSRLNYTLKILKNGKTVQKVQTHNKRRFLHRIRTINWKDKDLKIYLRVSCGRKINVWGKMTNFYNDGLYNNKKDFDLAFKAFLESD